LHGQTNSSEEYPLDLDLGIIRVSSKEDADLSLPFGTEIIGVTYNLSPYIA
jgi:hypothetical protein